MTVEIVPSRRDRLMRRTVSARMDDLGGQARADAEQAQRVRAAAHLRERVEHLRAVRGEAARSERREVDGVADVGRGLAFGRREQHEHAATVGEGRRRRLPAPVTRGGPTAG